MKLIEENVLYENTRIRTLHSPRGTFDFNWHCHEEYEISLILRGSGTRYTGDRIDPFGPEEMIFIPPGLPHTWQSAGSGTDNEVVVIQFRRDFTGAGVDGSPELRTLLPLLNDPLSQKIALSEELIALTLATHRAKGVSRLVTFLSLLDSISAAERTPGNDVSNQSAHQPVDKQIARVLTLLQKNWGEHLSIPDLAAEAAMSESSFRRHFRRSTGRGVVDYILHMKVARACEQLADPSLSITEISAGAGFSNLAFFNRKFKELKQMTPSEFRRRHNVASASVQKV